MNLMTSRELRKQRREAERKARKLEYQQSRAAAAALEDTCRAGSPAAEPVAEPAFASPARTGATGPTTPEGKAISSANSLKHGLASGRPIIPGEDPAEFEALLSHLTNEHAPAGETESLLVRQMAQSWWLMQRAIRIQNQAFTESRVDTHKLALFLRYQTAHERAFYRALNSLIKLKRERQKSAPEFVSQEKGTGLSVPKHAVKSPSHSLRSGQTGPSPAPEFVSQNPAHTPLLDEFVSQSRPQTRLRHSNSTIPAATDTFSEETAPAIGIRTSTSQCFCTP